MGGPRRRTEIQRKQKGDTDLNGPILDEQEQDAEIKRLYLGNDESNSRARLILNIALAVVTLISFLNLSQAQHAENRTVARLYTLQTILLPLSLSPEWLPTAWSGVATRYHVGVAAVQVVFTILQLLNAGFGAFDMAELSKLAMPAFISCAIEMQRRGERAALESLKQLEKARYKLKGA